MNRPLRFLAAVCVGLFELLMVFAFITMLAQWASAQEQRYHRASDAAAIAVHERYLRMTGTAKTPAHQHSILEMQMAEGPAMRTETYLSQPNRMLVRTTIADQLVLEFGYDGTTGWANSPPTGLTRLTEAALKEMRSAATSTAMPVIDSTTRMRSLGRLRFEGQPVDGIRMISAAGDTAESYYAVSSGLLIGMRMWRAGLVGAGTKVDTLQILFQDYRQVNGRTTYFTNSLSGMGMEMVSKTVLLEYAPIDPARFKPPAGVP